MQARPLLFLDVDGVFNCLFPEVEAEWVTDGEPMGKVAHVPVGTRERLAKLLPVFEPVWATAWMGGAHPHFREHLALPAESWPYVSFFDFKLTQLVRYAKGRPWAWVDDDAEWELKQLGDHWRDLPDSLVVVPHAKVGLTDEHVEQLLAFAEEHS